MQIRNDSAGDGSSRIDITRANRDAIRQRNPTPPEPEKPVNHNPLQPLGEGVRADFIAKSLHKRIHGARERAAESVHKRIKTARDADGKSDADSVTLSTSGQQLSDTRIEPAPVGIDARAQRVDQLKQQVQNGQLDVDGLVAETAYRMLGGQ